MNNYLITGCAGFIGSNFLNYIKCKEGCNIICLDKLTYAGNFKNIRNIIKNNKNIKFIKGDINNSELVKYIFNEWNINYVINFAAESHVDRSIQEDELFLKTNFMGVHNLLKIFRLFWQKKKKFLNNKFRFLQVSTDEVYGSIQKGSFNESAKINPSSPYSSSKASADLLVKSYFKTFNLPVLITRCSNNYGPYQFPEKLIPLMINNILNKKKLPVYGDGSNIRDWLYVKDHCKAIDVVLEKGKIGNIYNIGGNSEISNIKLVKLLIKNIKYLVSKNEKYKNYFDINIKNINNDLIKFVDDRLGHDKRYSIDYSKIINQLGWEPEISFEKGLEKTIKWYLDNQKWLENILTKDYQKYYDKMYNT